MVSVAVALPFASKVSDFGFNEQVGADCAGCTEQASATGSFNPCSELRVTVEVELSPPLIVPGVGAEAEIEKSAPVVFSRTLMVFAFRPALSGPDAPHEFRLSDVRVNLVNGQWKLLIQCKARFASASSK